MKGLVLVVLVSGLISACSDNGVKHVNPQNDSPNTINQTANNPVEDPTAKTDIVSGQYIGYSTNTPETTSLSTSNRHVLISHGFTTQQ